MKKKKNFFQSFFDILGISVEETPTQKRVKRRKKAKKQSGSNSNRQQLDLFSLPISSTPENKTKSKSTKTNQPNSDCNDKSKIIQQDFITDSFKVPDSNPEKNSISETSKKIVKKITTSIKNIYINLNYKITFKDKLGEGTLKEKCQNNIAAIRLLKYLTQNNLKASPTQSKKLVKYVGWGGLSKVFDENESSYWISFRNELKNLLSEEEYAAARRSTLTAFFTPVNIIKYIYSVLEKLGFTGGRILEPSCGIGHFIGLLPEQLIGRTTIKGVELDTISANIAKLLYPNSEIINKGFEDVKFQNASFDLVIGNIPFGDLVVSDVNYKNTHLKIHNYFLMKSLDLLREGGILAVLTSHFTLDSKDSSFREYLYKNAVFLGAVRLPSNAFKSTATETVSDILFLQKNTLNISENKLWLNTSEVDGSSTDPGYRVNNYFSAKPEMIMGAFKKKTNQFGSCDFIVKAKSKDLSKELSHTIKYFQRDLYSEISDNSAYLFESKDLIPAGDHPGIKEYSFEIYKDNIYQKQGEYFIPVFVSNKNHGKFKEFIKLKMSLLNLIDYQKETENDDGLLELQESLKLEYDSFIFKYGSVNSFENRKLLSEDPFYPLVSSLENVDEQSGNVSKADIFFKRTVSHRKKIRHTNDIHEALAISINFRGRLDFDLLSSILDKQKVSVICEFLNKKLIFKNPETLEYETREEYLSGNILKKIEILKKYLSSHEKIGEFKYNLNELKKVLPVPIPYEDIKVELGASWIDTKYIKKFIIEVLSPIPSTIKDLEVLYSPFNASWEIIDSGVAFNEYKESTLYGTSRVSGSRLIEKTLNMQHIRIYDYVYDSEKGKDVAILNIKETTFARQKQQDIKETFKSWIWKDEQRRKNLAAKYNYIFNSWVNRQYDGSRLKLSGVSALAPELRDYQKNAVYRQIYGGNTLLAHAVGSGKTFEMVAAGMEMKRLGICNKPMYVIPNHLIESGQFAREFMQLYPTANILVATSKDFSAQNRRRFISRIALGEWDAVLIGHSSFGLIPISDDYKRKFMRKQIDELSYSIEQAQQNERAKYSRTIKNMEKMKQNLEARLKNITESMHKDNFLTFEQLGVDQLFVDEAHRFKSLFLYTKLQRIPGVVGTVSQKAEDLFIKREYILEKNNWKYGLVFATGTPISNSVAEMYTMMRYLMPKRLEELSLNYFDAWASTFGEIVSSIEVDPTGTSYRSKLRFSKFHNVPELVSIFKEVADIVTEDMLDIPGKPKLENGKYIVRELKKCPELNDYIQDLVRRAKEISDGNVNPHNDNMLCVTNDGRKAALDPRLVGVDVDYPNSKINTCVTDVFNEWKEGIAKRTTHIIFCDLGTPKKKGKKDPAASALDDFMTGAFNVYENIKKKLILMGIPEKEIAFIHDASSDTQKKLLFKKFRKGEIRILVGSTSKCGEGCNFQDRLKSLHHLDVPWKPNELIQREGRILRVGNMNPTVRIYRYATKGTFDVYSWQTVERKATFISQVMRGDFTGREMQDIDVQVMSFSEMKAACSENPLIQKRIKNANKITELKMLKNSFLRQQAESERNLNANINYIKKGSIFLENLKKDFNFYETNKDKPLKIKDNKFSDETKAGEYILALLENEQTSNILIPIGEIYSFKISLLKKYDKIWNTNEKFVVISNNNDYKIKVDNDMGKIALLNKIGKVFNSFQNNIEEITKELHMKEEANIGYKVNIKETFKFEDELKSLEKEQISIDLKLNIKEDQNISA